MPGGKRHPGKRRKGIAPEILRDLEEYHQDEVDELEERISTGATAAETINQLAIKIETLKGLEQMALGVLHAGQDTKWKQLNRILGDELHGRL